MSTESQFQQAMIQSIKNIRNRYKHTLAYYESLFPRMINPCKVKLAQQDIERYIEHESAVLRGRCERNFKQHPACWNVFVKQVATEMNLLLKRFYSDSVSPIETIGFSPYDIVNPMLWRLMVTFGERLYAEYTNVYSFCFLLIHPLPNDGRQFGIYSIDKCDSESVVNGVLPETPICVIDLFGSVRELRLAKNDSEAYATLEYLTDLENKYKLYFEDGRLSGIENF